MPNPNQNLSASKRTKRLVIILLLVALGMFGFGYALVPLYDVICKQLGIGGKTGNEASLAVDAVDTSRTITVQFLATNNAHLPFQFRPNQVTVQIHPGQNTRVSFFAKNESDHMLIVQAIPSVSPGVAAKHLKKTECFCFKRQVFGSQESMDMPLIFHLDRELPKDVNTITLAYTLFDVTNLKQSSEVPEKEGRL